MVEWLPALKKDLSIQTEVSLFTCVFTLSFTFMKWGLWLRCFFPEMLFFPCNCFLSKFKSKLSHYSFNVSDFLICWKKKNFQYICSSITFIKMVILYLLWLFDNCLCTPLVTSSRRVETELILPTYFIPSI